MVKFSSGSVPAGGIEQGWRNISAIPSKDWALILSSRQHLYYGALEYSRSLEYQTPPTYVPSNNIQGKTLHCELVSLHMYRKDTRKTSISWMVEYKKGRSIHILPDSRTDLVSPKQT